RPRRQSLGEHWQDIQRHRRARLLRLEVNLSLADVLPPNQRSIAAPQASVEQHIEPHPLPRTKRPAFLVGGNVFLVPRLEAPILWTQRAFDASGRVLFDKLCLMRPAKQAAHGIEKVSCLMRCSGALLSPPLDIGSRYHGV